MTDRQKGYVGAVSGSLIWGFAPIAFWQLDGFSAFEIVFQRIFFAALVFMVMLRALGRFAELKQALLRSWSLFGYFILTSVLILLNWLVFIYAIEIDHLSEAALGYYIYPLSTSGLAYLMLAERVDRRTLIALILAGMAVLVKAQALSDGLWISLVLALTFSLYAICRKKMDVAPDTATALETLLLMPLVLGFFIWQATSFGTSSLFFGGGVFGYGMGLLIGVITLSPLVLFHMGNKYLPLSLSSLLFYINPTIQLGLSLWNGEPFIWQDGVAFGLIWLGLVICFWPSARTSSSKR
ncbi:MAG: EamA family transporter [Candidatus Puniceispirillaceae bacterium]